MARSPSNDLTIPMDDISETGDTVPITTASHKQSQPRFFWDRNKYRPSAHMGQELGRPVSVLEPNPTTWASKQVTHRQRAEIQLEAILNEPYASSDGRLPNKMSIEEASKQLSTQPFIVDRLIRALFKLEKKELNSGEIQKLTRVLNATTDVRALLFFLILDESTDQYVTRGGLTDFYEQYLKNMKTFDKDKVAQLIPVVLQKFHLDQKARIDFEEFYSIIRKDTSLLEVLIGFTGKLGPVDKKPPTKKSKWFLPKFLRKDKPPSVRKKKRLSKEYITNHLPQIIIVLLYILINVALAIYVLIFRAVQQRAYFLVVFARIGGFLLNFNSAFVVVLMLKRTILLIRSNQFLRKIIPVDQHIDFHRIVGRVIAGLALMHGIAHIANFAVLKQYSWGVYMFTTRPNIGWVHGFAPLSGVILSIILAIMVICSMEWIRRGGHFQVFYWTHLLYFAYFAFLIVHSRNFWEWVIGPLTVFLFEKIYSIVSRLSTRRGRTYLHSATIQQSNVISLTIHRPRNFTFKPGDYITINIPHIALYEFHPFTLSSAPEDSKYLTVHMQAVGNWTKLVYKRFLEMDQSTAETLNVKVYRADMRPEESAVELKEDIARANSMVDSDSDVEYDDDGRTNIFHMIKRRSKKREVIFVNGPYSSCARYVFDCKHVVLVGGGIGITPYASILSSLMAQFRASRVVCTNCQHVNYQQKGLAESRRLRKVDFIWVNRDQKNFEWFLNLLRQFEREQEDYLASNANEKRFLDIHLYFTEIKGDASIGNFPLALVSKVWEEVVGQDIFTSLKAKTHLGRPNWEGIFEGFVGGDNTSTANDVNVFFCGPSTMGSAIRDHCANYNFRYYEEKF